MFQERHYTGAVYNETEILDRASYLLKNNLIQCFSYTWKVCGRINIENDNDRLSLCLQLYQNLSSEIEIFILIATAIYPTVFNIVKFLHD